MPRRRIRTTTAIFISLPSWVFRFLSRLVRGATYNRGKKEERKEGRRGEGEERGDHGRRDEIRGKKVSLTSLVLSRLLDLIP